MPLETFIRRVREEPGRIEFAETIGLIESLYDFRPTAFSNGDVANAAGENSGSCKVFAFARRHELTEEQTLACFGSYYRLDVLQRPDASDHRNIRQFMKTGWAGVSFEGDPLVPRDPAG
ncbi:MAG: HopJ type III effector protein [Burkholderiaceae bacterium]|nr:HopJ type III effector protein [Burkholderiaceae bacterium]